MILIDETAEVSSGAEIGKGVNIGPYAIVESGVVVGSDCMLAAHGILRKGTILGEGVKVDSFAVIGGDPQDLDFESDIESGVRVGAGCEIREGVTIHRSSKENGYTEVGSDSFLMGNCHIAHDCLVGSNCVIANGVLLGGHVQIGEDVFVGGAAAIHQFVRVGDGTMIAGLAPISRDVPPYVTVAGRNQVCGLNMVGLRRRKIPMDSIADLKRCYLAVYADLKNPGKLASKASKDGHGSSEEGRRFLEFFQAGSRTYCRPRK